MLEGGCRRHPCSAAAHPRRPQRLPFNLRPPAHMPLTDIWNTILFIQSYRLLPAPPDVSAPANSKVHVPMRVTCTRCLGLGA